MTDDDVSEIAELEKCFAVPWSEKSFRDENKTNLRCILSQRITVSVSAMQGFGTCRVRGDITNVAVLPEYRKTE